MAKKAKPRTIIPDPAPTPEPTAWESVSRNPLNAAVVVLAVVVVVALAAVILGHGGKSHGGTTTQVSVPPIGPKLVSASALKTFANLEGQVIYWVGPVPGDRYELQRTANNDVFIRYLPRKADVGTKKKYLLVATYPLKGAFAALKSGDNGTPIKVKGEKGAVAAVVPGSPANVRVAFAGVDYQIEVFDPHKGRARKLATSGAVTQVP